MQWRDNICLILFTVWGLPQGVQLSVDARGEEKMNIILKENQN
jgi:hypothetical protein